MRLLSGVLSFAVAAALIGGSAARADAAFSDTLCPEAAQYVVALGALKQTDPPQQVYDAAHATTTAYDTCAKRHLAVANVEPGVHYAYTREAQFAILEARALVALNRPADAKPVLENAKRLASDVYDWRRSTTAADPNSKDTRPSYYHDSAKEIVDAANAMLAKLSATPGASPAPAPKPSGT